MKRNHVFKKFLAGVLTVLMVASLFATWPITTATAATADEYTSTSQEISNDFLKFWVDSDVTSFRMYTTGGNPDWASDNDKQLLFNNTSETYINVNGSIGTFSATDVKTTPNGNSMYSYYTYNGVKVERFISLVYNTYTSRYDTIEFKYVMTNTSTVDKEAGVRIMFDTMLGDNDYAPFRIAGRDVTTTTTYTGDAIPKTWQVMDSLTDPTVVASGTFYQNLSERPDKVQFINWQVAHQAIWECSHSGTIGDSAVNVYYNPTTLSSGESRTVKTYYGLGEYIPGDYGEMQWSSTVPQELQLNEAETAYLGNPFTLQGWVTNAGNIALTNVQARISVPAGMGVPNPVLNLGTIGTGTSQGAYWEITVSPTLVEKTYTYTVTVTADNVDPIVKQYTLFVPGISHTHDLEFVSSTPATCTEPGSTLYRCTLCGEEVEGYSPALGHWLVSEVEREATCTVPGITLRKCIRDDCDYEERIYVHSSHHYVQAEYVPATCTVDGYYRYACDRDGCDGEYIEVIPASHSYVSTVTKLPTATENGQITYTCSVCGHSYYEIIPMRPDATVLLVQDCLPWTENVNTAILNRLKDNGYINGWDMTTTSAFESVNLAQYDIIFIANDQTTATYNQLARFNARITEFANAGGVVVYGACDNGWSGGNISYTLPGGVTKGNYYSYRNYIVNGTHNIVTGVLTDGKSLTNELLYSTYSSHTYFTNLPENAIVILEDATGRPTLVEYPLGDGYVIASGLTWEYTFVRDFVAGTSFAKNVYDDVLVHAVSLCDEPCEHMFMPGAIIPPSCEDRWGMTYYCELCGLTFGPDKDPLGHVPGEWETIVAPTYDAAGWKQIRCTVCGKVLESEVIPPIDGPVVRIESVDTVRLGDEITFRVVVENCGLVKALAIVPSFNEEIFTLVGASWSIDGILMDVEPDTWRSVIAFESAKDVNTVVYTFTLKAIDYTNATTVDATFMLQDDEGLKELDVVFQTVSVIACTHENMICSGMDDRFHVYLCEDCGYSEMAEHDFDHGWSFDGEHHWLTCSSCGMDVGFGEHSYDGVCDDDCNVCGAYREAPHAFGEAWDINDERHWHTCQLCGLVADNEAHVYDNDDDMICNVCEYARYLLGDVDDDGDVDGDDSIYLLNHVFFGADLYPVRQPLDYNGDGRVTSDDSVYLLYHVFFGEYGEYPLYRG